MHSVFVEHPVFKAVEREIESVLDLHGLADEPPCLQIGGPAGIGKSTLFSKIQAKHPVLKNGRTVTIGPSIVTAHHVPLLCLEMPAKPSVISVQREMLEALGDPNCDKGSRASMDSRLKAMLPACGTKAVMIDEAQRLVDKTGALTAADFIDWIKTLHKQSHVSIILLGLPRLRFLFEEDDQIDRRWDAELRMLPYSWGHDEEPKSRTLFIGLLHAFQSVSPIPFSSDLDLEDEDTCKRFYYASRGVIGLLKKLLLMATKIAAENGESALSTHLLQTAFDHAFRKNRPGQRLINPFGTEWIGQLPPPLPDDSSPITRQRKRRPRKAERTAQTIMALTKS